MKGNIIIVVTQLNSEWHVYDVIISGSGGGKYTSKWGRQGEV